MFWQKKITVGELQQAMSSTTSVFGRDNSIKVTFDGQVAKSENGHVQFPAMDPRMELDHNTAKMFRGWVDSESALFRYSSMLFFSDKKPLQHEQPLLYDLFKAIECTRTEVEYTNVYPGAGKNLDQLTKECFETSKQIFTQPHEFYPIAINTLGRDPMPGTFLAATKYDVGKYVDTEKVQGWVDRIADLESPEESFELAEEILEEIKQDHPEEQVNEPKPAPGEGDGDGDGSPFATPEDSEEMYKAMLKESDDVLGKTVKAKIEEMSLEYNDGDVPYLVYSTEFDEIHHWKKQTWRPDVDVYTSTRDSFSSELSVARKKLELMIRATQKITWEPHQERGRIDSKRLVAAYQGDPHVFKVKDDASDLDTAIALSIDLSGSMHGRKARRAMEAVIVFSELLDRIGVPFEVTGFDAHMSSQLGERWYKDAEKRRSINYARIEAIRHHEFKKWGDRLFDARQYFHRIGDCTGSGHNNVDGESIQLAANSLLKRPEKRKVMFVFSDGMPNGGGLNEPKHHHLIDTVKALSKSIEVVGIGIMTDCVRDYYPKHIVVHNSENLPTVVMGLLKEHLLEWEDVKKEKQKMRRIA